jgi:hypothetical protein
VGSPHAPYAHPSTRRRLPRDRPRLEPNLVATSGLLALSEACSAFLQRRSTAISPTCHNAAHAATAFYPAFTSFPAFVMSHRHSRLPASPAW